MRITQAPSFGSPKRGINPQQLSYMEKIKLGMSDFRPRGAEPKKAKTKAGRLNLIRRVYAKMVREGQIIPPIGDA